MTDRGAGASPAARDGRRATVNDVAAAAGVSRSTASRALTGSGYVGHGVRERVQQAADALGYVPDAMARHLKQQVSRSIGLLVPDLRSPFCADVVAGVTREARRRGYATILTGDLAEDPDGVQAAERFVALRVAGAVVVPVSDVVTRYLTRRWTPVVEVDRHFGPGPADAVVVDDARLTRELTAHLHGLGHRRVVLLVDRFGWTTARDRRDGFLAATRDAGLDPADGPVLEVGDAEEAAARLADLLQGAEAPTAVVAASEPLAGAAWRTAAHLGLAVPRDLSLVAVDDAPWMAMVTPRVTAGDRDGVGLGVAAVGRLLDGARGGGPAPGGSTRAPTVLVPRVVYRGSTGPPAAVLTTVSHKGAFSGQEHR